MKSYHKLEYRELPYFDEEVKFYKRACRTSAEHGYKGFSGLIRFLVTRLKDHILQLIALKIPYSGFKVRIHKWRGVHISPKVSFGPFVFIDDVYPNYCVLEEGCSLSGYNVVLTHYKPLRYHKQVSQAFVAPTIIGKNAVLAVNVTVLPGIRIGEGSIIAAGSVVTKDIPPFVLAGGVPAKVLREYIVENGIPVGITNKA
jgi:acetyltransferase-like isoleucine patch superfamily enzyme